MSASKPPYFITTPIFYVNDKPHIGHAYTLIASDALARFARLDGRPVHFLTGTDEHGQKVQKSASAAGVEPLAFCTQFSAHFRNLVHFLSISNDDFIRTTEPRHLRACQALWSRLLAAEEIYLGVYAGWYAVRDEAFYGADEISGPDTEGRRFGPTGAPVEWVEEPSFFFRLSAWQDRLLKFYEANPEFIQPKSRRNEVISFVKMGLVDLSISRTSFSWGIEVPNAPGHIMYVWLDALTNYITALGWPDEGKNWQRFWPEALHIVGKDIIRFHAVYWPAFLLAAGLPPPRKVFAHGWWTNEGQKISKSLRNTIDPYDLVNDFGLDQTRYFLLREVPFGNDGDFSRNAMAERINADLANNLGNLVQRVMSLVHQGLEGRMPALRRVNDADQAILDAAFELLPQLRQDVQSVAINQMLARIWGVINAANRYIDTEAPWTLRRSDGERHAQVLAVLLNVIRVTSILLQPFIPKAAEQILDLLGTGASHRTFEHIALQIPEGTPLLPPKIIFPRCEWRL